MQKCYISHVLNIEYFSLSCVAVEVASECP